jgi:hypothetical protein
MMIRDAVEGKMQSWSKEMYLLMNTCLLCKINLIQVVLFVAVLLLLAETVSSPGCCRTPWEATVKRCSSPASHQLIATEITPSAHSGGYESSSSSSTAGSQHV